MRSFGPTGHYHGHQYTGGSLSQNLDDDALAWLTAVLVQLSGSLTMIAVQRSLCQNEEKSEQTE